MRDSRGRWCGLGVRSVRGVQAWRAHGDERVRAARVDRDGGWGRELGAGANALAVAITASGECGGHLGGEVDNADAVGVVLLRCASREGTTLNEMTLTGKAVRIGRPGVCKRRSTHHNEGKSVVRVESDVVRPTEIAGKRGDLPVDQVKSADAVVNTILWCIIYGRTR